MSAGHALLSPSGAHRWLRCLASVKLESTLPDQSSPYAQAGTAEHLLAAMALTEKKDALAYLGRILTVDEGTDDEKDFEVDEEMAGYVQTYLDNIRAYAAGKILFVEQRVPIGHITHEEDGAGTSDAIIVDLAGEEVQVHDYKGGRGVAVSAERNPQMMLYALGALEVFALLGYTFKRVRLVIHQPKINSAPDEWDCSIDDLVQFGQLVSGQARMALSYVNGVEIPAFAWSPGDKQCKFCKAKATCPALRREVEDTVFPDLRTVTVNELGNDIVVETDNLTPAPVKGSAAILGAYMDRIPLIEEWCRAVRAEVETKLFAGEEVAGYKLVEGKKGNRKWADEAEAVKTMESMRLKHHEMYSYSLITPPAAEKLLKKESPKRWNKLAKLVTQAEGKPSVAPHDDPRTTWTPPEIEFTDLRGAA